MRVRTQLTVLFFCLLSFSSIGQVRPPAELGEQDIAITNCYTINTPYADFAPVIYGGQLVYISQPRRGSNNSRTGRPFLRLHTSRIGVDGMPDEGEAFSNDLGGNYDDGPASFTLQNQVMYFTRPQDLSAAAGGEPPSNGIYSVYNDGYAWTAERSLPYNTAGSASQHPNVTPDGRRIFFSSNRPGGYGGYDLYFADSRAGRWGAPVNLGAEINTEGDETFPRYHGSGYLFFSSDGHGEGAGKDIYGMDLSQRQWGPLERLPNPVNSPQDELSFELNAEGTTAYVASNRPGGAGGQDVYTVSLRKGLTSLFETSVAAKAISLYDAYSSKRLSDAAVWVAPLIGQDRLPGGISGFATTEEGGNKIIRQVRLPSGAAAGKPVGYTDQQGSLAYDFATDQSYLITAAAPGYGSTTFEYQPARQRVGRLLGVAMEASGCTDLSGRVVDVRGMGIPLANVRYLRFGSSGGVLAEATTNSSGHFGVCLPVDQRYTVVVTGPEGWLMADSLDLRVAGLPPMLKQTLQLEENYSPKRLTKSFARATLTLRGIYYPHLSANPNLEASPDIDLLVDFLRQYPALSVLLTQHVDGPESSTKLQRLSEERATRLKRLLIAEGVVEDRIRTIGAGNSSPLVTCGDCSDTDYRANTRLEVKVIDWR